MTDISNSDDVIDSRDIISRIKELQAELDGVEFNEDTSQHERDGISYDSEWEELEILRTLAEEASNYADDWEYGETLIRDSYFRDYAQELAEDIGAINADAKWPNDCIDWEQAARELRMDYTAVDFAGVTYWIR
jgi:hypothetical protein